MKIMNKILRPLFLQWRDKHTDTPETIKFYEKFVETSATESHAIDDAFASAVFDESEEAFEAGFKTAVQLLMGGGMA